MISAAAALIADVIVPLVSFVFEMCMYLLIASVRPWRYLLSPSFRAEVNNQHAHKHSLIKWWYLLWGSLLLAASLGVIAGFIWFMSLANLEPESSPSLRQHAVEKVERTLIDKYQKHQRSKQ